MTDSEPTALTGAAAIFAVEDVARSAEFYRDALGFRIVFKYGQPEFYAGVERDDVVIHLQASGPHKRQVGQGALYAYCRDVDALHREFKARGARNLQEPQDYGYGMRDFALVDLDGNRLCFGMQSKSSAGRT
ncbi:MAG: VOC family protein [Alphaproteobacteria bacterium]|nr:VOC family protein [Alphaproteobacteria bacterium]